MTAQDSSAFREFDRLLAVVRTTRELLDTYIDEGGLPAGGADFIAGATLPHVDGIRQGFHGSLRTDGGDLAELRYLLQRSGQMRVETPRTAADRDAAAAEARAESRLASTRGRPAPGLLDLVDQWHLAALAHARLVLACLPRLPDDDVRFPGSHRSYADIPVPRGPAELADRIEELESQLWSIATGRRSRISEPAFRRTYGFFDAADRLHGGATFVQLH